MMSEKKENKERFNGNNGVELMNFKEIYIKKKDTLERLKKTDLISKYVKKNLELILDFEKKVGSSFGGGGGGNNVEETKKKIEKIYDNFKNEKELIMGGNFEKTFIKNSSTMKTLENNEVFFEPTTPMIHLRKEPSTVYLKGEVFLISTKYFINDDFIDYIDLKNKNQEEKTCNTYNQGLSKNLEKFLPSSEKSVGTVEVYNVLTEERELIAELPVKLYSVTAVIYQNSIYVLGGYSEEYGDSLKVYKLNEDRTEWVVQPAEINNARRGAAAIESNDKIYLWGGENNNILEIFNGKSWDVQDDKYGRRENRIRYITDINPYGDLIYKFNERISLIGFNKVCRIKDKKKFVIESYYPTESEPTDAKYSIDYYNIYPQNGIVTEVSFILMNGYFYFFNSISTKLYTIPCMRYNSYTREMENMENMINKDIKYNFKDYPNLIKIISIANSKTIIIPSLLSLLENYKFSKNKGSELSNQNGGFYNNYKLNKKLIISKINEINKKLQQSQLKIQKKPISNIKYIENKTGQTLLKFNS